MQNLGVKRTIRFNAYYFKSSNFRLLVKSTIFELLRLCYFAFNVTFRKISTSNQQNLFSKNGQNSSKNAEKTRKSKQKIHLFSREWMQHWKSAAIEAFHIWQRWEFWTFTDSRSFTKMDSNNFVSTTSMKNSNRFSSSWRSKLNRYLKICVKTCFSVVWILPVGYKTRENSNHGVILSQINLNLRDDEFFDFHV